MNKVCRAIPRSITRRLEQLHRPGQFSDVARLHSASVGRQELDAKNSSRYTGDGSTATPVLLKGLTQTRDPIIAAEIEAYLTRNHIRHTSAEYGADVPSHYKPNDLISDPPSPADISIELLMASQTHLGHATSLWNPANSPYIFGVREGIHIISLDVTAAYLCRAANIVSGVAERGGTILFAGTRKGFDRCVVKAAQLAGACHLFDRWMPGSITNGQQILGRAGISVVDEFDREVKGFESQLDNRPVLKPDLVVCLNVNDNYVMLHECGLANVPTIGIVDTDTDPTWVTYPIPANDDSLRSVALIAGVLGRAGQDGLSLRRAAALKGEVTFTPPPNLQPLESEDEQPESIGLRSSEFNRELIHRSSQVQHGTSIEEDLMSEGPGSAVLGPSVSSSTLSAEDERLLSRDIQDELLDSANQNAANISPIREGQSSNNSKRVAESDEAIVEHGRSKVG